ncbi:chondroitinase-B domain-containing protein [Rudanella lutea]|uniref:chondroitinase-B domain-containing protein n=1 Tax=Rudanella lutea TaxID=451374 RepID=UPI000371AA20|nr:chondroitinase-B domain-containing protein [Rudanella lutea]
MRQFLNYVLLLVASLLLTDGYSRELPVRTPTEFGEAVEKLQPGDTLIMRNGVWADALLVFKGTGTASRPIVLRAEKAGGVTLEGKSRLRLAGQYLLVTGLYFRNGYTPGSGVIEFREDSKHLAFNCRVTECVIDGFNNPDRMKEDIWVQLYGQHNRFDHNYVAGKKNGGVTLAVNLNDAQNQNNEHRIDHNYFGPRPRLGSNGGETIRVGVSTFSLTSSRTLIEENYFYHCNGEVEIISIKSCDNHIRRNLFVECEGGLVLRHGNRNLIEGNVFLGNGKPHTGGVRVINAGHKIWNNYFADLNGEDFRSALTIMNAVPNSPINRYHQVRDVLIAHNTFVNCKSIELAAGKDLERTARPENVQVIGNVFYSPKTDSLFHVYDDISGISFRDNVVQLGTKPYLPGLTAATMSLMKTSDGLLVPLPKATLPPDFPTVPGSMDITGSPRKNGNLAGAVLSAAVRQFKRPVVEAEAGPGWFRPMPTDNPKTGNIWPVRSNEPDALSRICKQLKPHDVVELVDTGTYPVSKAIPINMPLTFRAKAGLPTRPTVAFAGEDGNFAFFTIENGGALRLDGLAFVGTSASNVADCIIRTSANPMIEHYKLIVNNCLFTDLTEGRRSAFRATKSTYADTVLFSNCVFSNITGDVLSLAAEKEDKGIYNAEYVILQNCLFRNILTGALDLYRGGNDESTLGPFLTVDRCTFDNVGNVELGHVLSMKGAQWTDIRNCLFHNSGRAGRSLLYEDYGWTTNRLTNCNFYQAGRIESFYPVRQTGITKLPTEFINPAAFDYRLKPATPLARQATKGRFLGFSATP